MPSIANRLALMHSGTNSPGRSIITFFTLLILVGAFFLSGCRKNLDELNVSSGNAAQQSADKPNIILILADDIGYEVPQYTGGQSYQTPNINTLAKSNLQFAQCQTAPNCSPSRVMLLTGKYNFRNYLDWGKMDTNQYTIANLLHNAGYRTCVAGKWQLDGGDASIRKFGFDAYRIFLPYTNEDENEENWYRYKNPHIYQNGSYLPDSLTKNKYADNMFVNYIFSFIDRPSTKPFFVYYPMSLCHYPFCPTPDDPEYASWSPESHNSDTGYYPSMVRYMDKLIGQIVKNISQRGLSDNTIIFFLGDNGTPYQISSYFKGGVIVGGKGTTTQLGTHVPFVTQWTGHAMRYVNKNLIDLTDFLPTLADIAHTTIPGYYGIIDGKSFYNTLFNSTDTTRTTVFCQWQPHITSRIRRWSQTTEYKLYDTTNGSRFFNIIKDTLETDPIPNNQLTPDEKVIRTELQDILKEMHN